MKAVQIKSYGEVESITIVDDANLPTASKDQVVVDVATASLNPFDWIVIQGYAQQFLPLVLPVAIGSDFAGIITSVGENVSEYSIGDAVYGQGAVFSGGTGAFAEMLTADIHKIAHKPKNISFKEAASLPLVSMSAVQALETHIKLARGQKILIHGGAGGIGTIAIQLAKTIGAYVITTVRGRDADFVRNLGADQVIDFETQAFETRVSELDAVFDTSGGKGGTTSFDVLKKGGVFVSMNGQPDAELAAKHNVTAIGQNTQGTNEMLRHITDLVESGKIKPQVDKMFPLNDVRGAFTYLTTGRPRGKVVLQIKE